MFVPFTRELGTHCEESRDPILWQDWTQKNDNELVVEIVGKTVRVWDKASLLHAVTLYGRHPLSNTALDVHAILTSTKIAAPEFLYYLWICLRFGSMIKK